MSRHTIPNGPNPDDALTIGWDAPLSTFYARRTLPPTPPEDDPTEVFWIGGTPCEIPDIDTLVRALGAHGVYLSSPLATQLEIDRLAEGTRFIGRPATRIVAAVSLETAGPEQADRIRAELAREVSGG